MAQSDASSDRILWPQAIGSFGWLPFLVMAAGGLSLIDVLEHVFVQHLELATPFEMLLRGYQRIATILSALVEPYAHALIDRLSQVFGVRFQLSEIWRPLFMVQMILAFGIFRAFGLRSLADWIAAIIAIAVVLIVCLATGLTPAHDSPLYFEPVAPLYGPFEASARNPAAGWPTALSQGTIAALPTACYSGAAAIFSREPIGVRLLAALILPASAFMFAVFLSVFIHGAGVFVWAAAIFLFGWSLTVGGWNVFEPKPRTLEELSLGLSILGGFAAAIALLALNATALQLF